MTDLLSAFLSGDRPDDLAIYLADAFVDDPDRLADHGVRREDGVVLIVDAGRGRSVFRSITGADVMEFAQAAGDRDGEISADLSGGTCPDAGADDGADQTEDEADETDDEADADHRVRFLFSFAEAQNDDVGGLYAEGDVIHVYAKCECGTAYSRKWVVGDREA